ncbi:hypothetical protein GCM10010435_65810 [Winogradskya consettensis]|uniref:Uncharacterized protein n=1 Tax=Winogradskya consettensis TaxID=113560 RepID=A0A919T4N8_9ACTN|nr:hypothetical protein [Actinoplanes consettensis]GIM84812.1 hypothetical protein Aco04nite_93280 [Actinoplanes consettensis]
MSIKDQNRDGLVGPIESFIGERQRFARDVVVNVLANLLAAAILYILGVAVGLLPRSGPALFIAFVITGTLLGGSYFWVIESRKVRTPPWVLEAMALYGVAFYSLALYCFPSMPGFLRWFCYIALGGGLLMACHPLVARVRRSAAEYLQR